VFRTGLLVSTAMTAVTLLLSGAPTGAHAQTDMHVASRDPNTRFLCTYGEFLVSAFWGSFSSGAVSSSQRVAVPIRGQGQKVHEIRVVEAQGHNFTSTSSFSAGIYSNSPSGLPGKEIAGGTGRATARCGPVTISVAPTKLKRHTTYWIEETMLPRRRCRTFMPARRETRRQSPPSACSSSSRQGSVYWVADPDAKHTAYAQDHRRHSNSQGSSSYTSPWTKLTKGPRFKLK
jgi:hypothetical protein